MHSVDSLPPALRDIVWPKCASEVIQHLQAFFQHFQTPRSLVVDRYSPFLSQELEKFCTDLDANPARHGFNGLVERSIQTLRNMVRCTLSDSLLPSGHFLWIMRSTS